MHIREKLTSKQNQFFFFFPTIQYFFKWNNAIQKSWRSQPTKLSAEALSTCKQSKTSWSSLEQTFAFSSFHVWHWHNSFFDALAMGRQHVQQLAHLAVESRTFFMVKHSDKTEWSKIPDIRFSNQVPYLQSSAFEILIIRTPLVNTHTRTHKNPVQSTAQQGLQKCFEGGEARDNLWWQWFCSSRNLSAFFFFSRRKVIICLVRQEQLHPLIGTRTELHLQAPSCVV